MLSKGNKRSLFLKPKSFKYSILFILLGIGLCLYLGIFGLFLAAPTPDNVDHPKIIAVHNNHQNFKNNKNIPPLEDYIQGWNITGNVSWLMDFAIVGFPKTGTSTLMLYLESQSDSIFTFGDERCELGWNQHVVLLKDLYRHYQPTLKMGIKCPSNLEVDLALKNYNQFFPTTKFIVGVRNPIQWFESFYNFRVTNEYEMPPPHRLIGKCKRFNVGVCTNRANFSQHLSKIEPWREVFIYDVAQLKEEEQKTTTIRGNATTTIHTRGQQFRNDLTRFLGLSRPLNDPMIWVKPGLIQSSPERAKEIESKKIHICHPEFENVKNILKQHATESATWITETFLQNPHVHVSSRDYFIQLLQEWHKDPCESTG